MYAIFFCSIVRVAASIVLFIIIVVLLADPQLTCGTHRLRQLNGSAANGRRARLLGHVLGHLLVLGSGRVIAAVTVVGAPVVASSGALWRAVDARAVTVAAI